MFSVYFVKLKVQQIPVFLEYNKNGMDIVKKDPAPKKFLGAGFLQDELLYCSSIFAALHIQSPCIGVDHLRNLGEVLAIRESARMKKDLKE